MATPQEQVLQQAAEADKNITTLAQNVKEAQTELTRITQAIEDPQTKYENISGDTLRDDLAAAQNDLAQKRKNSGVSCLNEANRVEKLLADAHAYYNTVNESLVKRVDQLRVCQKNIMALQDAMSAASFKLLPDNEQQDAMRDLTAAINQSHANVAKLDADIKAFTKIMDNLDNKSPGAFSAMVNAATSLRASVTGEIPSSSTLALQVNFKLLTETVKIPPAIDATWDPRTWSGPSIRRTLAKNIASGGKPVMGSAGFGKAADALAEAINPDETSLFGREEEYEHKTWFSSGLRIHIVGDKITIDSPPLTGLFAPPPGRTVAEFLGAAIQNGVKYNMTEQKDGNLIVKNVELPEQAEQLNVAIAYIKAIQEAYKQAFGHELIIENMPEFSTLTVAQELKQPGASVWNAKGYAWTDPGAHIAQVKAEAKAFVGGLTPLELGTMLFGDKTVAQEKLSSSTTVGMTFGGTAAANPSSSPRPHSK